MDNIATIIVAAIAALPGILALIHQRRKINAEANQANADASVKYAEAAERVAEQNAKLTGRIEALEAHVDRLEVEIAIRDRIIEEWQAGIERLLAQLASNELVPVWKPKPITKPTRKDTTPL